MRKTRIILLLSILVMLFGLANMSLAADKIQMAKDLIDGFRTFNGSDASVKKIESNLAIDIFIERALSEYWNKADFAPYKDQVKQQFRKVLKLSTYDLMKKFFHSIDREANYVEIPIEGKKLQKAVSGNQGLSITKDFIEKVKKLRQQRTNYRMERYQKANVGGKEVVIMSACISLPYKTTTSKELLNLRFDFQNVNGKLMIVDMYFAWFDNTNYAAVCKYMKKGSDGIYSIYPYEGFQDNPNYAWMSTRNMKSITSTFGGQMAGVIRQNGGGKKGYEALLKALDDYIISENKRVQEQYK